MKKKINTAVVGIKFYGITKKIIEKINEGAQMRLEAEPENPHDSNAVAVYFEKIKIGHIRASEAPLVSRAMKELATAKAIARNKNVPSNATYFDADVLLEKETTPPQYPTIAPAKTAGIYKIHSTSTGRYYIGQSIDVNIRIKEHWNSLLLGVHPNSELQKLWTTYGEADFKATLVAAAPEGLSSAERQIWLGDSETHYINQGRKYGSCLNKYSGKIVLTQELRDSEGEYEKAKRLLNNEAIIARRNELKQKLATIDFKLRTLNEAYNSTIENIFRLKDIIREKTGIRSLFNGRLKKRERAVLENQILSQQRLASEKFDEMRKVTSMQTDLAIEISSLKTNEFQIRKD